MADKVDTLFPDSPTQSRASLLKLWREAGQSMTVAEAQGADLTDYPYIFVSDVAALFFWNLTSTEADDSGVTTIVDATGKRFTRFVSGSGGDVTAAAAFGTDNAIIRSDGTGKGVQASVATIDDTTGDLKTTGTLSVGTTTNPYQLTVRKDQAGSTQFSVGNYASGGASGFRLDAFGSHYIINLLYGTGTAYYYTNANLVFGTYAAAKTVRFVTNVAERMRLHDGGLSIMTTVASAALVVDGGIRTMPLTVATLGSASAKGAGTREYVTDEVGGPCFVFSDGTNWKLAHEPTTTASA